MTTKRRRESKLRLVRKDSHGLYVRANYYIYRPEVGPWTPLEFEDLDSAYQEGEHIPVNTQDVTTAKVGFETWHSHRFYLDIRMEDSSIPVLDGENHGWLDSEECWEPRDEKQIIVPPADEWYREKQDKSDPMLRQMVEPEEGVWFTTLVRIHIRDNDITERRSAPLIRDFYIWAVRNDIKPAVPDGRTGWCHASFVGFFTAQDAAKIYAWMENQGIEAERDQ